MSNFLAASIWSLSLSCALLPVRTMSQDAPATQERHSENTIEGTTVSSTRDTLVVRTEDNQFHLFVFDRDTVKPQSLPTGSRIRVASTPGDETGVRHAITVTQLEAAPRAQAGTQAQPPPAVRDVEHNIERQVRRWRMGVRGGVGLDPELILFGVHSQIGPLFHRDVSFRPNAEFAFGEVTDLIALNLEAIYTIPMASRQRRWSPYIGAGPGLTFIHQSFRKQGESRNIDFSNFDFNAGFNILTGVQFSRTFFEIKSSIYSQPAPTLRLIVGYNF